MSHRRKDTRIRTKARSEEAVKGGQSFGSAGYRTSYAVGAGSDDNKALHTGCTSDKSIQPSRKTCVYGLVRFQTDIFAKLKEELCERRRRFVDFLRVISDVAILTFVLSMFDHNNLAIRSMKNIVGIQIITFH